MLHNFIIKYNPQVYLDIQNAVDYYSEQTESYQLSKKFLAAVENTLSKLKKSALRYQIRYNEMRLIPISHFPYRAHYRVDMMKHTVFIEGLFHTGENPEKWRTRLNSFIL